MTAGALLELRYELGMFGLVPPQGIRSRWLRQYAIGTLLTSTVVAGRLGVAVGRAGRSRAERDWLRGHPARLAGVTVDQVADAALEFFTPTAYTGVIVGDAEVLSRQLAAIGGVELP